MMILIRVIDTDECPALIPYENIAFITVYEGTTRIYLRQVAGVSIAFYVLTKETPDSIMSRLRELSANG
jgi:hypothetical protein